MLIDLARGGASWEGFYFAPYGKSREWRLHVPGSSALHADDLRSVRQMQRDIGYLQTLVKKLETVAAHDAMHFCRLDALTLIDAAEIIARAAKEISVARLREQERRERIALSGR